MENIRSNWIGYFLFAVLTFMLAGIGNSLFGNFFSACAKVITNASDGFWRKFVDLYFAYAARSSKLDFMQTVSVMFYGLWLCAMVSLPKLFKELSMSSLEKSLAKYDEFEQEADGIGSPSVCEMVDIEQRRKALKARIHKDKAELQEQIKSSKRSWRRSCVFAIFVALAALFSLSLDLVSYSLHRSFDRRTLEIRPGITDKEYYELGRQWVLMRSRSDYEAIGVKLDAYNKRLLQQESKQ